MKAAVFAPSLASLAASGAAHAQCLVKFRPAASYLPGGDRIAVGDINGDGKQDVVVNVSDPAYTAALLGPGDGSLQSLPTMNGDSAASMALADLNGDGQLDLVMGAWGAVVVRLGNGDGTFQPTVWYGAGSGAAAGVVVADFDGDGRADLAVANNYSNNVSILRGNGNGTLQPAVNHPAGTSPVSMTGADVNGDGVLDLVVGLPTGISILLGNGDGSFQAAIISPIPQWVGPVRAVAVADFNADDRLDVVAVTQNGGVWLLLGNGNGSFQEPAETPLGSGTFTSVVAADFNNDGKADVAIGGLSPVSNRGAVVILQGNGSGGFMYRGWLDVSAIAVASLAVADLRGIGRPDILATSRSFGGVSVLLNASGTADFDGDGSPGTDADIEAYFACLAGNCCTSCASADFNGDGDTGTDADIDAFFRVLSGGAC